MLIKLFGSNTRVKMLKLFLSHPDQKYYIRQLSRDLGLQVNSIRRELNNLEKFGLLFSSSETEVESEENVREKQLADLFDGKIVEAKEDEAKEPKKTKPKSREKKYYQVNKNFILFDEIKSLIIKSQALHDNDFVDKIKKIGSLKLFMLTGVFVGNNNFSTDMLIVGQVNKTKLLKIIEKIEKELDREINFTIMDMKEFKYRREITDVFLYNILENKKIVVVNEVGV